LKKRLVADKASDTGKDNLHTGNELIFEAKNLID
jgi:hypothetical protein